MEGLPYTVGMHLLGMVRSRTLRAGGILEICRWMFVETSPDRGAWPWWLLELLELLDTRNRMIARRCTFPNFWGKRLPRTAKRNEEGTVTHLAILFHPFLFSTELATTRCITYIRTHVSSLRTTTRTTTTLIPYN